MPQDKSVNNFEKGLTLSSDAVNRQKGTYSYALNAVKEDAINAPSVLTNEKGFTKHIDLGYNYILLGSIYLGKDDRVLFIKHVEGDSPFNRIILIRNNNTTTILDNIDLNFQDSHIIRGTYRINYKNETIIYWVDGLNDDRFLNIDSNQTITDLAQISIDIRYVPAVLDSRVINDFDGNLKTGAYEFYASYVSEDNAATPWFVLSGSPSYIIDDSVQNLALTNYVGVDGSDSNIPTTKSIDLNLVNLDPNFKKLQLGIIRTIGEASTAFYIDNIAYNGSTKTITYTGFEQEIEVDISQFLVDPVRYNASNAITQSGNRLLRANMKSNNFNIKYQAFANNIEVEYYIEEELVSSMQNSQDYDVRSEWWRSAATKYSDKKSLMRDEVYSLGVAFGLKNEGIETPVYHIPGRALNSIPSSVYTNQYKNNNNPSVSNWDTSTISENGETVPRWKIENTAALSVDGNIKKLAYWESEQRYPDGFNYPITGSTNNGTNNTNVRHHKMPSTALEPLYRREEIGDVYNFYKRNIGLKFNNITIPDELKDNVAYIRFYISPRNTEANKSIIAKGIFTNVSLTKIDLSPGSGGLEGGPFTTNYWAVPVAPYNDLDDPLNSAVYNESKGTNTWNTTNNHYHSFFSPDTTLKNPVLNVDRVTIDNEITGIVHYYDAMATKVNAIPYKDGADGNTSVASYHIKRDIFYGDENKGRTVELGLSNPDMPIYNLRGVFKPTYKSISIFNSYNKVDSTKSRRRIKSAVYVPFNAKLSTDQLGSMDNPYYAPYGQGNVLIELNPSYSVLGGTDTVDTSVNFTDNDQTKNNIGVVNNQKGTFHFFPITNPLAVYRYGSIKRTNPSQYGDISDLEYIPTDLVIADPEFNSANTLVVSPQGLIGDSWIDMFSIQRTKWANKRGYTYGGRAPEVHVGVSTFFTESNINHRLRYSDGTDGKNYYPKQILTTPIKEWLNNYNDRVLIDNFYKYNNDYHKISSKRNYALTVIDLDTQNIVSYPTRIIYSEKLLDEERSDSYRVYLANNYKDLPKNKGSITHLFSKSQELYAITRDTIWKIYASNQTIKSESSDNITIGTGEFFSLDPVEVLSIDGGYAGSSSKMGLVETPYGYFYCDRYKGRFILFDNQQKDIALIGINEFIKDNFALEITKQIESLESEFDNPLANFGYLVGYEPESQRILVTKLDYSLTPEAFLNYVGVYDPSATYQVGDIYLKDGNFYEYVGSSSSYQTVYESSNLSNFIPSTVDPIDYSITGTPTGTVVKDPVNSDNIIYTPQASYTGSDYFNIVMGCISEAVAVTVENAPTVPNYTVSLSDSATNGTTVVDVNGTYTTTLTYSIISSDDVYGIFTINSSTGVITVLDNYNLNYYIKNKYTLTVRVTATDGKFVDSIVTINVTQATGTVTGVDSSVTILDTTSSNTTIKVLPQATVTNLSSPILIYSIDSESVPGVFEYDLDDPNNLTVTLINNSSLNAITTPSYTLTFKVEDNDNPSISDTFTLTVNVLFDSATLTNEAYLYSCSGTTKTWINARVKSSRYNSYVHTYNNISPAGKFQEGTIGEFNLAYYAPEADSSDCALPVPVIVNYNHDKSSDPVVDLVLIPILDSVNLGNIYGSAVGTFSGTMSGDSLFVGIIHQIAYQPWPDDSKARLVIKKNSITIYDSGDITNPLLENLASTTITLEAGSIYDIYSTSSSTSTAYKAVTLNMDNQSSAPLSSGSVVVDFEMKDDTDNSTVLKTGQYIQPQLDVGFNYLDDSDTASLEITNNHTEDLVFNVSNGFTGGTYNEIKTIETGDSDTFINMPKSGYNVLYTDTGITPPVCPDRNLVFQICNSNAAKDDNFDIYLNDVLIGSVDLNYNAQVGSVFIASDSTPTIVSADFTCSIGDMVAYYFSPSLLIGGINTIKMVNTQNNGNGNYGTVGVRNYLNVGGNLSSPCGVANMTYNGPSGRSFELTFSYEACCE